VILMEASSSVDVPESLDDSTRNGCCKLEKSCLGP